MVLVALLPNLSAFAVLIPQTVNRNVSGYTWNSHVVEFSGGAERCLQRLEREGIESHYLWRRNRWAVHGLVA
jgi:hypothetical protein